MNSRDEDKDRIYEKLHEAAMRAIASSDEVKKVLRELDSNPPANNLAVFNLILSLEELATLSRSNSLVQQI